VAKTFKPEQAQNEPTEGSQIIAGLLTEKNLISMDKPAAFGIVPVKNFRSTFNTNINQLLVVSTIDGGHPVLNALDIDGNVLAQVESSGPCFQIIRPSHPHEMIFGTLSSTEVTMYKLTLTESKSKEGTMSLSIAKQWSLALTSQPMSALMIR